MASKCGKASHARWRRWWPTVLDGRDGDAQGQEEGAARAGLFSALNGVIVVAARRGHCLASRPYQGWVFGVASALLIRVLLDPAGVGGVQREQTML